MMVTHWPGHPVPDAARVQQGLSCAWSWGHGPSLLLITGRLLPSAYLPVKIRSMLPECYNRVKANSGYVREGALLFPHSG